MVERFGLSAPRQRTLMFKIDVHICTRKHNGCCQSMIRRECTHLVLEHLLLCLLCLPQLRLLLRLTTLLLLLLRRLP